MVAADRTEKAVRKQAELIGGLQTGLATLEARLADYQVRAPFLHTLSGISSRQLSAAVSLQHDRISIWTGFAELCTHCAVIGSALFNVTVGLDSLHACVQEAMTAASATGSDADSADYLAGLRAVLDPASSEASSATSAGPPVVRSSIFKPRPSTGWVSNNRDVRLCADCLATSALLLQLTCKSRTPQSDDGSGCGVQSLPRRERRAKLREPP